MARLPLPLSGLVWTKPETYVVDSLACIKNGWFTEDIETSKGQAFCLEVKRVLHHERSPYQDVLVFESTNHGNVLVLDGIIQCTEREEFAYQEVIAHTPLNCHPNPRKVLVIGGGDGGVLREIVKHECVEEVVLCEIDDVVIRVSKKYLPHMAVGLYHPKVTVHVGDGFKYMAENSDMFDVIITDSSDAVGPATVLYELNYYRLLRQALNESGIICNLVDSAWVNPRLIRNVLRSIKAEYPSIALATAFTPAYISGQISFIVASKEPGRELSTPIRRWTPAEEAKLCRYYTADTHKASFTHPTFVRKMIRESLEAVDSDVEDN
ncbi:spermidine synthase [Dimargaris cristalligena]|uniref:Spermidine synthase n=1 Tax=Dimargaris cristalligena TaxID=215637 RepID=A0A4P9ZJM5_9FUNG|nr:spermidine synthase [Dimargaris cristalligena]|eukprot:RKP33456.1 spermidine synthase [Dimargaris cristalligena]